MFFLLIFTQKGWWVERERSVSRFIVEDEWLWNWAWSVVVITDVPL